MEGKVTGVEYVDKSGKKHVIEATLSVVAAAGGFGANPQMRALHDPRMLNLTTTNQPGATGDLIPLLQDIGAEVTGMDFIQCNPGCPPGRSHRIIMHLIVRNFIMVDLSGKRFVAEDSRRDVIRDAVLSLPKQTAFSIINQYVRFVDEEPDKRKNDWKLNDRWAWFIGDNRQSLKLTTKPEPYTLDRTLRWVQRQVAPTLKMLKKIDKGNGTDYMETIEQQAKLTEKHEMIIKQQTTPAKDLVES